MSDAGKYLGIEGLRDMDFVITTRELAMLAKDENIDFAGLADQPYDDFMGIGSGAGVIFGNTGGVMEAAVRSAYTFVTKKTAPASLVRPAAGTRAGRYQGSQCRHRRAGSKGRYRLRHGQCP